MRGRGKKLAKAVSLIEAGLTVDIVGTQSSGRTTLLRALCETLEERGWNVIVLRGIAALRDHPYASLHLADIGAPSGARDRPIIQRTVTPLREQVANRASVVLIDDWDDFDESSWGVVEAVRRETGVPLVRVRGRGTTAQHTPTGLTSATLEPSFVIEVDALPLDTLEEVVSDYLEGPVEISTMGRIYEKSGGIVGLALSLVDAALRDELLVRSEDGFWTAQGSLWSPSLRGIVESQLVGITTEARQALEMVARVGVAELATVRRLVEWEALEDLEARGLLRLLTTGGGQLVNVTPPLLVDYFRHDEHSLRHLRLTEFVTGRLGADASEVRFLENERSRPVSGQDEDALLRSLLFDRARTRQIVTRAEWERTPRPAVAVRYLSALISSGAPLEMIDRVFRETDLSLGDGQEIAEFTVLEARWQSGTYGDLPAALDLLEKRREDAGRYRILLDTEAVLLTSQLEAVPADWDERLTSTGEEPLPVIVALTEARIMLLVIQGRFTEGLAAFEENEKRGGAYSSPLIWLFGQLARAGCGDLDTAVSLLYRALEEATEELDIEAIRASGAGLVILLFMQGDLSGVDSVLRRVFTLGDIPPLPMAVSGIIVSTALRAAFRRGDDSLAEHRTLRSNPTMAYADFAVPFNIIPQVQVLIRDGRQDEAATLVWERADRLWHRGLRLSSQFAMSMSLELVFDADRFERARERAAEIDGPLFRSSLVYVEALSARNPTTVIAAAEAFEQAGRYALALHAYRTAAVLLMEQREPRAAEETNIREQELLERLRPREIEITRFFSEPSDLSDREREIARLASKGLSNQQIADDLVLSVRTVESHVYHALRKLGLSSRQSLRYYREKL